MPEIDDSKRENSPEPLNLGQAVGRSGSISPARSVGARLRSQPYLLYGIYLFCLGTLMYVVGILMVFPRYGLGLYEVLTPVSEWLVWYSGMPMVLGLALSLIDLLLLFESKRPLRHYREQPAIDSACHRRTHSL